MNCADAHDRIGNSIHGEGGTPTRNHDAKHQFMAQGVKSLKNHYRQNINSFFIIYESYFADRYKI